MDASIEQWEALAALLPPDQAADVVDCVMIGEQEGAIEHLATALLVSNVPTADNVRAEIAVLAELWGVPDRVEDTLRRCAPGGGGCVTLAPQADPSWLHCTTCGGVLTRGGDGFRLSDPDGTWDYDRDELWEAFATLHDCCDDPTCRLAPWLA